jgi:hypothetical protein
VPPTVLNTGAETVKEEAGAGALEKGIKLELGIKLEVKEESHVNGSKHLLGIALPYQQPAVELLLCSACCGATEQLRPMEVEEEAAAHEVEYMGSASAGALLDQLQEAAASRGQIVDLDPVAGKRKWKWKWGYVAEEGTAHSNQNTKYRH